MANLTGEASTQEHLDIADIQNDLVVCKNGQISLILETTAVNFDLLSEKEQEAKILAFAALINSLNFFVQILVRTEKTDISVYIDKLNKEMNKQKSDGLRKQIEIYISFIKNLTYNTEVLDKRFFVVVSGGNVAVQRTSFLKKLFGKEDKITNLDKMVEGARAGLFAKRDFFIKQLQRMGVFARQLSTDELIRLFYSSYNPDTQGLQKLQIKYEDINANMITGLTVSQQEKPVKETK